MKYFMLSILFVFLASCRSPQVLRSEKSLYLFPNGIYQQSVLIQIQKKSKIIEFDAILNKTEHQFSMHAYNHFGITLLTVKSDVDQKIEFSSSLEEIQKRRDFIMQFMPYVQKMLFFPSDRYQAKLVELESAFHGKIELVFDSGVNIPRKMIIESSGSYRVEIVNRSYRPLI